jgi:hypothetical protein
VLSAFNLAFMHNFFGENDGGQAINLSIVCRVALSHPDFFSKN